MVYACISVAPLNWTVFGQVWQAPFSPIVSSGLTAYDDLCARMCAACTYRRLGRWRRRWRTRQSVCIVPTTTPMLMMMVVVVASCTPQRSGPQAHSHFFFPLHGLSHYATTATTLLSHGGRQQTGLEKVPNEAHRRNEMSEYSAVCEVHSADGRNKREKVHHIENRKIAYR